ncbi:MAG: hypothetical protein ABJ308_15985 [Halieaceae bacterium]
MLYSANSPEPSGEPDMIGPPPAEQLVVVDEVASGSTIADDSGITDRDIHFAALVSEVFNLRGEVEALSSELRLARSASDGGTGTNRPPSEATPTAVQEAPTPSAQDEFLVASGNGDGLENISTAFVGAAAEGTELVSSSCQGNMCRVSYQLDDTNPGLRQRAVAALTSRIEENIGADVDMIFAREGGESVIYVKLVN